MYKKIFMSIAAVAALTLVSCSSDDLNSLSDNSSKNEAISFDGYLGRSAVAVNGSRGSELTKEKLKTDGFGVFGNYKKTDGLEFGSNWFDNVKVTCSSTGTKWTYSPVQYWLPQGHIDFLAYAPYDSKYNNQVTENNQKLEFIVSSTIKDQKDLLWANATNKTKTDKPVTFNFNHALAKIGYTVKTNVVGTGTTITLNKITLAGSATEPATGAFYTKGTIDLAKTNGASDLWTNQNGKQHFTWFNGTQKLTSTSASNLDTDYLFVIPQNFSTGTDELYVIVDYTINYNTGVQSTMETNVYKQLKQEFKQGKAYTINLTIGLTPIEFDADVTPWTDDNNKNTNINIDSWE